ncbi:MAG TPA: hypothetical protein VGP06_13080 [Janthinobacterium sp.]|nr:hypothetical protein [Janthinobacterium sp.]
MTIRQTMKTPGWAAMLLLALLSALSLAGCAGQSQLKPVREFAAQAEHLDSFADLTLRYRDTTARELPYLAPAAAEAERNADATRQAAAGDFLNIQKSVALYMRTLGRLAGEEQYDVSGQFDALSSGIQAWPGNGLDPSHTTAYAALTRLVASAATASAQNAAVQSLVSDADAPLQSLLEAMGALLRYYDKIDSNEKKIVLGFFDIEIPFANTPRERLLSTLAKAQRQEKTQEYARAERRLWLARKHLDNIAAAHSRLAAYVAQPASAEAQQAIAASNRAIRANLAELEANPR